MYFLILLLGISSLFITKWLIAFAKKHNLLNYPNERSLHSVPMPCIGGVAIVITWFVGLIVFFCCGWVDRSLFYAFLCGLPIAIVSLIDDLKEVKPIIRLSVHFVATVVALYFLGGIRALISFDIGFDYQFLVYPLAILGMMWFINLFNFMDGADGYASVEAISISLMLYIYSSSSILLLFIFVVAGFLYWNWPKAKIFMGDTGSTQMGFVLIVLGIYFHNHINFSILNWIMLAAPFWFDATFTLYRRWRNHEKLSLPHKKHAFQRFVLAGYSHKTLCLGLIALNVIIVCLVLLYRTNDIYKIPVVVITLISMYLLTKLADRFVPFR